MQACVLGAISDPKVRRRQVHRGLVDPPIDSTELNFGLAVHAMRAPYTMLLHCGVC